MNPLGRRRRAALAAGLGMGLGLGLGLPAAAATWHLKPGGSLQAVLAQAADGDQILVEAGDYRGQVAVVRQKRLTLRGVGGRPVFHADGRHAEGKAILVLRDGDFEVHNIEFRGARVPDRNGAGIRFERGRLLVQDCAFFDNQMGLLTANFGDAELEVRDSEFGQAPPSDGHPHLLYVGRIARFSLSGSRFSGGRRAHLVKSRAAVNLVRHNWLVDGPGGQAAYELEFPNGGVAQVVGNVIGQSAATTNSAMLSFGAEGSADPARRHELLVLNNTFVNDGPRPAWFVRVWNERLGAPPRQRLANNLFAGPGVAGQPWHQPQQGNLLVPLAELLPSGERAFSPAPGASWRGKAVAVPGPPLEAWPPPAEFKPPLGTRPLPPRSAWHPGAYQD